MLAHPNRGSSRIHYFTHYSLYRQRRQRQTDRKTLSDRQKEALPTWKIHSGNTGLWRWKRENYFIYSEIHVIYLSHEHRPSLGLTSSRTADGKEDTRPKLHRAATVFLTVDFMSAHARRKKLRIVPGSPTSLPSCGLPGAGLTRPRNDRPPGGFSLFEE